MDLDLVSVDTFIAVATTRHFGRAATELGVSVSAVSKRLARLEHTLGVPLIERDSSGFIALTPAGERFIRFAPTLTRSAQRAIGAVTGQAGRTLRLAVPEGVGVVAPLLPAALATLELALQHAYPDVTVETAPTPFPRMWPDLRSGVVDAVLTFGESPDPAISSVRLSQIHRVGMLARSHPLAVRHSIDVHEFARLPMIYDPELPDDYMLQFILADVQPLDEADLVPIAATNTAHVAQRILQGREVTVVPLALTGNLAPELRRIFLIGVPDTWYYCLRRRDDERPELLTAIDLMADFTESISRSAFF